MSPPPRFHQAGRRPKVRRRGNVSTSHVSRLYTPSHNNISVREILIAELREVQRKLIKSSKKRASRENKAQHAITVLRRKQAALRVAQARLRHTQLILHKVEETGPRLSNIHPELKLPPVLQRLGRFILQQNIQITKLLFYKSDRRARSKRIKLLQLQTKPLLVFFPFDESLEVELHDSGICEHLEVAAAVNSLSGSRNELPEAHFVVKAYFQTLNLRSGSVGPEFGSAQEEPVRMGTNEKQWPLLLNMRGGSRLASQLESCVTPSSALSRSSDSIAAFVRPFDLSQSPLQLFRAYRLHPDFPRCPGGLPLSSPSVTHALDPHKGECLGLICIVPDGRHGGSLPTPHTTATTPTPVILLAPQ